MWSYMYPNNYWNTMAVYSHYPMQKYNKAILEFRDSICAKFHDGKPLCYIKYDKSMSTFVLPQLKTNRTKQKNELTTRLLLKTMCLKNNSLILFGNKTN